MTYIDITHNLKKESHFRQFVDIHQQGFYFQDWEVFVEVHLGLA
jgi:hypothetical protein